LAGHAEERPTRWGSIAIRGGGRVFGPRWARETAARQGISLPSMLGRAHAVYIAFRFEWGFTGAAAVLAFFRRTKITLAFCVLQYEMSLTGDCGTSSRLSGNSMTIPRDSIASAENQFVVAAVNRSADVVKQNPSIKLVGERFWDQWFDFP